MLVDPKILGACLSAVPTHCHFQKYILQLIANYVMSGAVPNFFHINFDVTSKKLWIKCASVKQKERIPPGIYEIPTTVLPHILARRKARSQSEKKKQVGPSNEKNVHNLLSSHYKEQRSQYKLGRRNQNIHCRKKVLFKEDQGSIIYPTINESMSAYKNSISFTSWHQHSFS